MTNKNRTFFEISIPLIVILVSLVVLALYEGGIIQRLHFKSRLVFDEIAFDESELISVTPSAEEFNNCLMLVNSTYKIPDSYEPPIVFYRDTDVPMNSYITYSYGQMSDYIRENLGDHLYVSSTYRSFEDQERVYEEEGPEIAALPGTSEHQTGLAVDVYVMYFAGEAFINSETGRFINQNCQQFGFIIRYPDGSSDITGFEYEPWHLRYVGFPHAQIITEEEITLEEYIEQLEVDRWFVYDSYLICRQSEDNLRIPSICLDNPDDYMIMYSHDNMGNVIITIQDLTK